MHRAPDDPDRVRRLIGRAKRDNPEIPRSALRRAADVLTRGQRWSGDDTIDVTTLVSGAGAARGTVRRRWHYGEWMREDAWPSDPPWVDLELTCDTDDGLAETWTLPAPLAALVAANWALRLAICPGHDAVDGYLTAREPLFLYDGTVMFGPPQFGAGPQGWAHDLDPHSRTGGSLLRTDISGIGAALRARLSRPTGTVLEALAGKHLTVTEDLHDLLVQFGEAEQDDEPDEQSDDRVGAVITVTPGEESWTETDFMTAVRDVGAAVAAALGGPGTEDDYDGADVDRERLWTPEGSVSFSWYTYRGADLRELRADLPWMFGTREERS